ncbi:GNAT family N-acetyltransferase [Demetria terragena]|uniref:GNAT family N-acetyltransferase n=1 Tax=Demetria terragena TaxID=63959 RepID=UPI000372BAD9|nr:GNAT family N-acetyltransferase [Demetria terragena]
MLRPATSADLEAIRRWRNHPEVQAVSLNREEITAEMHSAWWEAVESDDTRQVLVYERNGAPAGVVTFFDIAEHDGRRQAMWGYYLDNAGLSERGELLPAWIKIQREAVRYADEQLNLDALEGEVIESNEGVRSMNSRNGFEEIRMDKRRILDELVTVYRIRRVRPQR